MSQVGKISSGTDFVPPQTAVAPNDLSLSAADPRSAKAATQTICRTSDGVLHTVFSSTSGGVQHVFYSYSTDGGATWSGPVAISTGAPDGAPCNNAVISCDALDNLYVAFRAGTIGSIAIDFTKKPTGGAWTAPSTAAVTGDPNTDHYMAIGSNGDIVITFSVSGVDQCFYLYSTDGGTIWHTGVIFNNGHSEVRYPSIAADGSGNIHCLFWMDAFLTFNSGVWYIAFDLTTHTWTPAGPIHLDDNQGAFEPNIMVDRITGDIVATWSGFQGGIAVRSAVIDIYHGGWHIPTVLNYTAWIQRGPNLAMSGDGHYHIFYREDNGLGVYYIWHSEFDGSVWSAPDPILPIVAESLPTALYTAWPVTNYVQSGYIVTYLTSAPDVRVHNPNIIFYQLPVPSALNEGKFCLVKGLPGYQGRVYICMKLASGVYVWKEWVNPGTILVTVLPIPSAIYDGVSAIILGRGGVRTRIYYCTMSDAGTYAWNCIADGGAI